jgi:hypothetical protein
MAPSTLKQPINIAHALTRQANAQPETVALILPQKRTADGWSDRRWSYRELDELTDRLAAGLQARGIGKGTRVAFMVPPSLEFFALFFALFKAGCRAGADRSGYRPQAAQDLPGRGRPGGVHRHHPRADCAHGAGLGARQHPADDYRRAAPVLAGPEVCRPALARIEDFDPPERRRRRRSRDPVHLRLDRYSQGRGLSPPHVRRPGRAAARDFRISPGKSTCRPSRRSPCSTRRWA